jgi:hypothetical protein
MVDAFLLPPSHDLFHLKGTKDLSRRILSVETEGSTVLAETVYASRYKV